MKILKQFTINFILVLHLLMISATPFVYSQTIEVSRDNSKQEESVIKWLNANAKPLKSIRAGTDFTDLKPLKAVLKETRIVGLGEATHGTREFFQLKHRLLEFLIKEMDFKFFIIEGNYPSSLDLNDYVMYGKGNLETALLKFNALVWNTQEMRDLIFWMREYNKNLPESERVRFLGVDMQNYGHAYERLYPFLKKTDPDYTNNLEEAPFPANLTQDEFQRIGMEATAKLKFKLENLINHLNSNKAHFLKLSSEKEYEEALQCARIMYQFVEVWSKLGIEKAGSLNYPYALRDFYMAKNIEFILNSSGPNTKSVLWGHNQHISLDGYTNYDSAGKHLRRIFGDKYYAMGFSFNQGSFRAMNMDYEDKNNKGGLEQFSVEPAPAQSIESYFGKAGLKDFIVDFRHSRKPSAVTQWLSNAYPMRRIGAGYHKKKPEMFFTQTVLKASYDGFVFISESSPTQLNALSK